MYVLCRKAIVCPCKCCRCVRRQVAHCARFSAAGGGAHSAITSHVPTAVPKLRTKIADSEFREDNLNIPRSHIPSFWLWEWHHVRVSWRHEYRLTRKIGITNILRLLLNYIKPKPRRIIKYLKYQGAVNLSLEKNLLNVIYCSSSVAVIVRPRNWREPWKSLNINPDTIELV